MYGTLLYFQSTRLTIPNALKDLINSIQLTVTEDRFCEEYTTKYKLPQEALNDKVENALKEHFLNNNYKQVEIENGALILKHPSID